MNSFIAHIQNTTAVLTTEESWHCAKVLRKKVGETIRVIDGKGNYADAVLQLVSEKQTTAKIIGQILKQEVRNYYFHLAIAPTKQIDRIEWMVEKAVEIGIDELSFLNCKNSERKVVKIDRIKKIVESAVKQSLQAIIPKVNELVSIQDILKSTTCHQKLIAHCFDTPKLDIKQIKFSNTSTLILIGPEGDFTKQEIEKAIECGFDAIRLGNTRLRSETAGLYVCHAASILTLK